MAEIRVKQPSVRTARPGSPRPAMPKATGVRPGSLRPTPPRPRPADRQPPRPLGRLPAPSRAEKSRAIGRLSAPSRAEVRRAIERKAEMAARNKLYRMGYTSVRRMQHDGIHGVDLGAFKYDRAGRLRGGAVAEVKGRSSRRPGPSVFKNQVRPSYYAPRLKQAQAAGVKGADQLYNLYKRNKLTSYGITHSPQQRGAAVYQVVGRTAKPQRLK